MSEKKSIKARIFAILSQRRVKGKSCGKKIQIVHFDPRTTMYTESIPKRENPDSGPSTSD